MSACQQRQLAEWLILLENRYVQEIRLGLTRIRQVAQLLDLLTPHAKIISVGGTNGKGSTVALLEAIYCEAGYAVGSYTSPHLITFNERIKVNQQLISDDAMVSALEVIEEARGTIELTYFEMITLAALWHFHQHHLDVIILEVGLGGRLDATNIIDNDLAIITSVALDHQAYLGNTIEAIGYEKAGILRAGKPFIYADVSIPQRVKAKAASVGALTYCNGEAYHYQPTNEGLQLFFKETVLNLPRSPFHSNSVAAAALGTVCLAEDLPVSSAALIQGINNTVLHGRLQLIKNPYPTLLDVAHNPHAAHYLARYLAVYFPNARVHAVFSAFADKDIPGLIEPLKDKVTYWYPALLPSKRAASSQQLLNALNASVVKINMCYNDPILAYEAACNQVLEDDLIVVYGSFITVGLVLSTLSNPIVSKEKI